MPDPEILAKCLGNLWICHDKRDFKKIDENALRMVENLGYPKLVAKKIVFRIQKAYRLHAELDEKVSKSRAQYNEVIVAHYKDELSKEMGGVFRLAGCENYKELGRYHCSWWFDFTFTRIHHKWLFYFLILWHLLALHITKFKRILPALSATYWLCLAGIYGHDRRNNAKLFAYLTKYWMTALKYDSRPLIF